MLRAISQSLRLRFVVVVLATTLIALLVAGSSMMAYELHGYQKSWENDSATQAEILGKTSAAALEFDDPKTALENLALLQVRPAISAAAIYTAKGGLFATYVRNGEPLAEFPRLPRPDGSGVAGSDLTVFGVSSTTTRFSAPSICGRTTRCCNV